MTLTLTQGCSTWVNGKHVRSVWSFVISTKDDLLQGKIDLPLLDHERASVEIRRLFYCGDFEKLNLKRISQKGIIKQIV